MNKKFKLGLVALALAGILGAQTASADTIKLETWWGGSGSANITLKAGAINYNDGSVLASNLTESGGAGGFKTLNVTAGGPSFLSFCVDIFHSFSFPVTASATKQTAFNFFDTNLTAASALRIATDLGKLATNHLADADDPKVGSTPMTATQNENSVAFQLAVWEIVNENYTGGYGLSTGNFLVNSASPSDSIAPGVKAKADAWLGELSSTTSHYNAYIWGVSNGASGSGMQDVVIFTPVPEPEIYAMMAAGLGLMGFVARRRKQAAV